MSTTTAPLLGEISAEIEQIAAQLGVSGELPRVLAMTQALFPNCPLHVEVEDDPEIANDRHLVIVVRDRIADVRHALAARWTWNAELFGCCPAPLAPTFRLGMEYHE